MDLKQEIIDVHSKADAVRLAARINEASDRFDELVVLLLKQEPRTITRGAWVLGHCFDQRSDLLEPHIPRLIQALNSEMHESLKRNIVRALQNVTIPEDLMGETADLCFKFLGSATEPIAIKVFAMTVLGNICEVYPDLKNELELAIEDQLPFGSAGFKNRAGKVLKRLNTL